MSSTQASERKTSAPVLTLQQEQELARRWQRNGDEAARNLLVQSQLGYARSVARRRNGPSTSVDELLAEGSLGLIQAANRFDPERGYRFFTYAKHWVHVYVSRCANRRCALRSTRLLNKVRRERARAISLVGDGPQVRGIIAARLDLSDAEVEALLCALARREVSFEAIAPEQIASESQLRDDETDPEQRLLLQAELSERQALVNEVLGTLDQRERSIVTRRLMADSDTALTLEELGREFGISRERVRQLEARLKQKLARQLRSLSEREAYGHAA
ncbi:MAG TPA: sigma-70 family RNA polymerase sigma factor [Polyangiaceae bacterium]|nr:sigma-70 family RNA polymerase sigma factor [Polyangiaceae bacterium]